LGNETPCISGVDISLGTGGSRNVDLLALQYRKDPSGCTGRCEQPAGAGHAEGKGKSRRVQRY
jgi:hypothetical protein